MNQRYDPLKVMAIISALNALAGFASLLRSGEEVTFRSVLTSTLNSSLIGLAIALLWWQKYGGEDTSIYFLMGVSLMAGLGGNTTFYFITEMIKRKYGLDLSPKGKDRGATDATDKEEAEPDDPKNLGL